MSAMTYDQLHEVDRAVDALMHQLCPSDFESWWKLLGDGIAEGIDKNTLRIWCESGDNFDERVFEAQYRSLNNRPPTGRTGMLFRKALDAGWVDRNPGKRPSAEALEARKKLTAEMAAKAAAQRAKRQARAEEEALRLIEGTRAPDPDLAQLKEKAVGVHGDLRFLPEYTFHYQDAETGEWRSHTEKDVIAVPIRTERGKITSLQFIFKSKSNPLGENKYFLPGGRTAGGYFLLGHVTPETRVVIIAEGYSTGASIFEALGSHNKPKEDARHIPVMVAFCAGNLEAVAKEVRAKLGAEVKTLIAGDNDLWRTGNPGVAAAKKAASAIGGYATVPPFEKNDQAGVDSKGRPKGPTDWNDWHAKHGRVSVAFHIQKALDGEPYMPEEAGTAEQGASEAAVTERALAPDAVDAHAVDAEETQEPPRASASNRIVSGPVFGDPVDLFSVATVPQIPLDVLPAPVARYAADQAQLMGCDHSVVAMAALAAAASCINDGIQIQPKRHDPTWTESARLWVAIVGSPSTKKSPAISKAVHHVKAIDRARRDVSEAGQAKWSAQHAKWKSAKKRDEVDAAPEPKAPPAQRALVEDVTVEALGEVLKDNPQGVLVLRDELTGWLGAMDAYKGGSKGGGSDRANWLELYNGGQRSIDRVMRGSVFIPNWSACLVGGIQPDMMRRVAASMGNDGLLQRFIPVVARQMEGAGEDRAPDMHAIERYRALFDHLSAIQPGPQRVKLSEEAHLARERVDAYAGRMARAIAHNGMEAWLGKWSGLFARMLLTMHVCECSEQSVHPTARPVSGETAEKVERLMCGTLLRHAVAFYGEIIDQHDRQERARELARLILARGWTVMRKRDLQRNWKAAKTLEAWELHDVVNRLCDMDWLDPDRDDGPGPDGKPRTWFVNPAVHKAFADHAERERNRRAEVVETLRELKAAYAADRQAAEHGATTP